MIRTPLWIEIKDNEPIIVFDLERYGIDSSTYIPPLSKRLKRGGERKKQAAASGIDSKKEAEQAPEHVQSEESDLDGEQEETLAEYLEEEERSVRRDNNIERERLLEELSDSPPHSPRSPSPPKERFKELFDQFLGALKKFNGRGEEEEEDETSDTKKAKILLRSGKMDVHRDFKSLNRTIQIKILTFQFYDIIHIIGTMDGIVEKPESREIAPNVFVTTKQADLGKKGFGWTPFYKAFSVLARWALVFAPEKVSMILEHQSKLDSYQRARYPFTRLVHWSNYIRKQSFGKNANWVDPVVTEEAFRMFLSLPRDPYAV